MEQPLRDIAGDVLALRGRYEAALLRVAAGHVGSRALAELRAPHGRTPEEVCALPRISDANQRVTLHRARSKVRACLGPYLDDRSGARS